MPICGKISHCLFDKTGTLTTDQLVPVGIVDIAAVKEYCVKADSDQTCPLDQILMSPVSSATSETAMILAACHSLVVVKDHENDEDVDNEEGFVIDFQILVKNTCFNRKVREQLKHCWRPY